MRGFWVREVGGVRLLTPFDQDFITELKDRIPYRSRAFDADTKSWIVKMPYVDDALELAAETFEGMTELYSERPATATPRPEPPHGYAECVRRVVGYYVHEAALWVIPGAPEDVVRAAYKALALSAHPDVAGPSAHGAMVRLNAAYAIVRDRARQAS